MGHFWRPIQQARPVRHAILRLHQPLLLAHQQHCRHRAARHADLRAHGQQPDRQLQSQRHRHVLPREAQLCESCGWRSADEAGRVVYAELWRVELYGGQVGVDGGGVGWVGDLMVWSVLGGLCRPLENELSFGL
jgi:hypothetical protein